MQEKRRTRVTLSLIFYFPFFRSFFIHLSFLNICFFYSFFFSFFLTFFLSFYLSFSWLLIFFDLEFFFSWISFFFSFCGHFSFCISFCFSYGLWFCLPLDFFLFFFFYSLITYSVYFYILMAFLSFSIFFKIKFPIGNPMPIFLRLCVSLKICIRNTDFLNLGTNIDLSPRWEIYNHFTHETCAQITPSGNRKVILTVHVSQTHDDFRISFGLSFSFLF